MGLVVIVVVVLVDGALSVVVEDFALELETDETEGTTLGNVLLALLDVTRGR